MSGLLNNIYNNVNFSLHLHSQALYRLQEQVSTGSRLNHASDDPSAAYRVLTLESQFRGTENYMNNVSQLSDTLEITSSLMNDMISVIGDKKVHLTQIVSGTYDQQGRDRVAEEVDDAIEHLLSLANTRHLNQYLFGGSDTQNAPYVAQRTNGQITSVTYAGSMQQQKIEVTSGIQTEAFYVGENLFTAKNRQDPVFLGDTGAATGSGTSNVSGDVWLQVTHDGSNYKLSIDNGQTQTTVPASGDVSNIKVTNAAGQVLYVDAANISATGTELVRIPGTYAMFDTLISIRDMLKNEIGLTEAEFAKYRTYAMASLSEVENQLVEKQVSIGSKIGFLEKINSTMENIQFNTESEKTSIEQADIAQIALDISRREVLYQMSLSVAGKLMSMSLLDFI